MVNFRLKLKPKFLQVTEINQGRQKAGMGSFPQGILGVILNSGAGRNVIQNLLQVPPMRHSVLDTESPASIEGFKLFSPLQFVQLCDSGSQPGMTKKKEKRHTGLDPVSPAIPVNASLWLDFRQGDA